MSRRLHPLNQKVGAKVRERRILLGMSQRQLADAIGLTFQQVQKYEKGSNRISASRLQQIAQMLEVPVAFFFEGAPTGAAPEGGFADMAATSYVSDFLATSEGVQLTKAFVRIRNPRVRRRVVELVEALAEDADETAAS